MITVKIDFFLQNNSSVINLSYLKALALLLLFYRKQLYSHVTYPESYLVRNLIRQNERQWNRCYKWQKTTTPGRLRKPKLKYVSERAEKKNRYKTRPIKDQFMEENEKLVKRIKIDSQPKLHHESIYDYGELWI